MIKIPLAEHCQTNALPFVPEEMLSFGEEAPNLAKVERGAVDDAMFNPLESSQK